MSAVMQHAEKQPPPSTIQAQAGLAAIKARQQATWASGDYAVVGSTLQIVGESLCEAVDLRAGQKVLDVAAGNGNATLAAARRYADVVSTDYVGSLLELGRTRAAAEGHAIEFREADAENLPFRDAAFDVVLSTYGVMFTPDQKRAAAELARVCRSGGKIGLANWTPEGFIGQLFRLMAKHIAPPPGLDSPLLWGTEDRLAELLGAHTSAVSITRREFMFRYRSPMHWIDIFRTFYGPVHKAFLALDGERQIALESDLVELIARFDRSTGRDIVVPAEYLEVVITRR